jgi:gluconate 2-dehydrogenase gamma chain
MAVSTRRQLLMATYLIGLGSLVGRASHAAGMPWQEGTVYPPGDAARPGTWLVLTPAEAATLEAIVDRLIPPDENGPGGKDAGCVVFIDRQLAGPYGTYEWYYMEGPFPADPLPSQGLQSPLVPRQQYRLGLAALSQYCKGAFGGKEFQELAGDDQDKVLTGLQTGALRLAEFDGRMLFGIVYQNTVEGYFADPVYGGNKDMCGWKLIGFPGARYDYRDVMDAPNKPYALPPVSLQGRPDWNRTRA